MNTDRQYWVSVAQRLAQPVLAAAVQRRLRRDMPVERSPHGGADRAKYSHLEAVGRLVAGLAPWLELPAETDAEGRLRGEIADLVCRTIDAITDPNSADFLNFNNGGQPLVDAAFLAQGLIRAPRHLWDPLEQRVRANVVAALQATRPIKPPYSNWLLFSAIIEAALCRVGQQWNREPVDHAIRTHHDVFYKGDGHYGDGPEFHCDYYNSFVIHPMLLDVVDAVADASKDWDALKPAIVSRAQRYAAVLERMISPEGTFPAVGRSLAYRMGALQVLGQMALRRELPAEISPAQVRCAMTAVIKRMMESPGTFDAAGWLTIGFCGHQPFIGEPYISTGSTYLCAVALLPLGLPADDPFWTDPPADWTAKRIWSGREVPIDHAL